MITVAFLDFKSEILILQRQHRAHALPGLGVNPTDEDIATNGVIAHKNLEAFICNRATRFPVKRSHVKVFLGHGLVDAYVDVELGRQARQVLSAAAFDVEWKEYSGAEEEGHWPQEPNEMDDVHWFMLTFSA